MKLEYDETLSKFAFKLNLHRYIKAVEASRTDPNFYVEPHTAVVHVLVSQAGAYTGPLFSST